jgi:outer membrane protein TolC
VGIGLDYVFTEDSGMGGADSGKDPIVAMFSVSLPLARSKYRAAEREARAERAAAVSERADRENNLAAELQEALYGFRDAERKIGLYRDTLLPMARQSIEVARQSFEAGKADFLDLIEAQRTLLEFELSHARALADRVVALAGIEMLVGRKIEGGEQERRSP